MMRIGKNVKAVISIVFVCLLVGLAMIARGLMFIENPSNVQAAALATTEYWTPTFVPTSTPVPSATIGYEATLFIAQATADEARRVNAQVTAQYEANQIALVQLTADAENRNQQVLAWTAQAGPTVIPLTATIQAIVNTHIAEGQRIAAGQLTATHEAPTQYAAMLQVQDLERYGWIDQIVRIVTALGVGFGFFGLGVFALRWKPAEKPAPVEMPRETVIHVRKDTGAGTYQQAHLTVPCSPEQLSELAEMAVNGEKKFGINRLETNSRTFRNQRATLIAVREFMINNKFMIADGTGATTLNDDGEIFLAGWFESQQLPTEYDFVEVQEMETA